MFKACLLLTYVCFKCVCKHFLYDQCVGQSYNEETSLGRLLWCSASVALRFNFEQCRICSVSPHDCPQLLAVCHQRQSWDIIPNRFASPKCTSANLKLRFLYSFQRVFPYTKFPRCH
uniref:Putative secreted protein n=1 Tax=Ixodes ricinus TaxID=34613 RepID=A0A6B0UM09_IXORI